MDEKPERFAQFAVDVMGVEESDDVKSTALKGIEAVEEFYRMIEMPTNMKELGINIIKKDPRDDVFVINCVPLGNKKIVMQKTAHSEYTKEILRKKGYTLFEVEYDEAGKAGGGLHCATLPLIRDYVDFSNL